MYYMTLRNLRLYFRDRTSVFFSMLSVFIVIALYTLFLFDNMMSNDFGSLENARYLLHLWLIGGLLSIVSLTTTLAAYGVMVNDRIQNIIKDIYISDMKRWKIVVSYILAACIIGISMSIFTLLLSQLFLFLQGFPLITWSILLKVLVVCLLSVFCSSSMMFLIALFLKSASAFSNISTIVGTLSGFMMGIYIPIGVLPAFAQNIIRFFPLSHGCAALRKILMESHFDLPTNIASTVYKQLGIEFTVYNTVFTIPMNLFILCISSLLCLFISIYIFRRQKKR